MFPSVKIERHENLLGGGGHSKSSEMPLKTTLLSFIQCDIKGGKAITLWKCAFIVIVETEHLS